MLDASDFALFVRMIVTTTIVIGLLLGLAALARRGRLDGLLARFGARSQPGQAKGTRRRPMRRMSAERDLVMEDRIALGRDNAIVAVRWGTERMLVGITPGGMTALARRDSGGDDEAYESSSDTDDGAGSGEPSFHETLEEVVAQSDNWLDRLRDASTRASGTR